MTLEREVTRELVGYRFDQDESHFRSVARRFERAPRSSIVAALQRCPDESIRFLESEAGTPWRGLAGSAELDVHWPPQERLAVAYRLLAEGARSKPLLGWEPFTVVRLRPDIPQPPDGVPAPIPRPNGHRTRFEFGERRLSSPDTRWFIVHDAEVQDGGSVRSDGVWYAYEPPADPLNATFISGLWQTHQGTRAHPDTIMIRTAPAAPDVIDEGILIAGRNDENWYQFLVFYLPRVLEIPEEIPADVPVLLTARTPPAGVQALRELTSRPIRIIDPAMTQRVRRLHVGPPVANMRDDGYEDWSRALTVRPGPLLALRAAWGVLEPRTESGRRIFLHRRAGRRGIVNADRIAAVAREAGLEAVDPATLSFAEQRGLFSSAELVVGATGAVMANYLFMRPGSRIIGLTSDHLRGFISPPAMAWISGCAFEYVTGPATIRRRSVDHLQNWVQADYRIPSAVLRRAIAADSRH